MGVTQYYPATSIDGYIADERNSLDWLFVQDIDAQGPMNYDDFIAGIGAIVMGATTYEWIRARITAGVEKWGYTMPAVVFTHRDLPRVEGADLRFAADCRTAARIASGTLAAQRAFVEGRLRVGGDLSLLTTHQRALASVGDALAGIRPATTYD